MNTAKRKISSIDNVGSIKVEFSSNVCDEQSDFKWKCTETVINCHFPATRCKLCYIAKSKQLPYCFTIKTIKHKNSKLFTVTWSIWKCLFRSNSQVVPWSKLSIISRTFTKLVLPCNSVHAYSPKQSLIVFFSVF